MVVLYLVVAGIDAAGRGGEIPGDPDRGSARTGEIPVDQYEAFAVEAEVVPAQVPVDQRLGSVRPRERVGENVGPARQVEHRLADVRGHEFSEGVPALLELLREEVRVGAFRIGDPWAGHSDAVFERRGVRRDAAAEGVVELCRG